MILLDLLEYINYKVPIGYLREMKMVINNRLLNKNINEIWEKTGSFIQDIGSTVMRIKTIIELVQ